MLTGRQDYINIDALNEVKQGVLFIDFINKMVEIKSKRLAPSFRHNYKTIIYHLNNFCELTDATLYTNSINEEFLEDFNTYLEHCNLRLGYIKNIIQCIKGMVKRAAIRGYIVDPSYEDFVIRESDDRNQVYLSMNEITRLYYYENLTKKQTRIRDLFIIGCLTGLRYSDYSNLDKSDFVGDYIIKLTKKTKKKVTIPLHDYVKEIYQKYDGNIPKSLSIQYFNRALKQICKKVGINEKVWDSYIKGGKLVNETKEKWEVVCSHTARRSAATNMYLTKRMATIDIMQITGHTTETSFFKYIKIQDEDKARNLSVDSFFRY
jgi:integrase